MNDETRLTDEEISKSSLWSLAVRWLWKQGPTTVLLFLILGAITWGGHYSITTAIPQHLQQIQKGYENVIEQATTEHRKVVDSIEKSHESERQLYRELLRGSKGAMAGTQKLNGEESLP